MPQMVFPDYAPQLVWLVITFAVFYFLMARIALPRIAEILEQRQSRVSGDLEQAKALRDDAAKALKAYEATVAEARARAHTIAMEMREQIAAEAERRRAAFEAELDARTGEEEARIQTALAAVRENLRAVALEAARAASAKLLGAEVKDELLARSVDAEIRRSAG